MKAYLFKVLVIDGEGYGHSSYETEIEQHRHINGKVISTEEADIGEWEDDHPLNTNPYQLDLFEWGEAGKEKEEEITNTQRILSEWREARQHLCL